MSPSSSPNPPEATATRVLEFPATPVGTVHVAARGSRSNHPAAGRLEVPGDADVRLELTPEALESQGPAWLDALDPAAVHGLEVDFAVGAAEMALLSGLSRVRWLKLGRGTTDEALAALSAFPALAELDISSDEVSDAGLHLLPGVPTLTSLSLESKAITGAGAASLAALPALVALTLSVPDLDDDALAFLPAMPALMFLGVTHAPRVSGEFLAPLAGRPLNILNLKATGLADEHVAHLAAFPLLMATMLDRTPISDAAVDHLAALPPTTRALTATRTRMTDAGVLELHRRRPDMTIDGVRYFPAGLERLTARAR